MKYKVHPQLKYLSANLKRLNMGYTFSLKEFGLVLEENLLDDFWDSAEKIRKKNNTPSTLATNLDSIYEKHSQTFIIGLDLILREYYLNKINIHSAKRYFTNFFKVCFSFFIKNNIQDVNYSTVISALEQNDFMNKSILTELKKEIVEVEQLKNNKFEIIDKSENKNDIDNKNLNIPKKYQIFISSTFIDLIEERQAAVEAILKKGHIPAGMELFTSGDKSQWEVIKKWIDDSDIYLLILGGRYGSIDKSTNLSYTEMEYNYAVEKKKPLFALILDDEIIFKKSIEITKDYDLKVQRYIDFKTKVKSKMCSFPKNTDQIKNEINHSIDNLISDNKNKMNGWVKGNIKCQ